MSKRRRDAKLLQNVKMIIELVKRLERRKCLVESKAQARNIPTGMQSKITTEPFSKQQFQIALSSFSCFNFCFSEQTGVALINLNFLGNLLKTLQHSL